MGGFESLVVEVD